MRILPKFQFFISMPSIYDWNEVKIECFLCGVVSAFKEIFRILKLKNSPKNENVKDAHNAT